MNDKDRTEATPIKIPNNDDAKADPKLPHAPDKADPWIHRSSMMKCLTCMWFVRKEGQRTRLGRCRRHAPTMSGYPVVYTNDWCGDHKVDESAE